jgi:hypothetical protein
MRFNPRRKLAIGAAALAACSFAGGAYAAAQDSDASATSKAFLNDVANRLDVTPQKLTAALDGALSDQLNAAVKAGKLTQTQANAIERRVERQGFTPFGPFGPGPFGRGRPHFRRTLIPALSAGAKYLGISVSQLSSELRSGRSLEQIARSHGKSVAGLRKAVGSARQNGYWGGPRFGPRVAGPNAKFGPRSPSLPPGLFAPSGPPGPPRSS